MSSAAGCELTTRLVLLNGRTSNRSIGAKYAAIARERLKTLAATLAVVKELAGVGGHGFDALMAARRAGEC
jgi:hypothetical protein